MVTCRTTASISKAGRSRGRLGAQHGNFAMASTYVNRCKCTCLCVGLHMNQMAFETFMLCNKVVEAFGHRLPTRTLEYSCGGYEWWSGPEAWCGHMWYMSMCTARCGVQLLPLIPSMHHVPYLGGQRTMGALAGDCVAYSLVASINCGICSLQHSSNCHSRRVACELLTNMCRLTIYR